MKEKKKEVADGAWKACSGSWAEEDVQLPLYYSFVFFSFSFFLCPYL